MRLFDDVGNIIGLTLGKRRNAMLLWEEREEQKRGIFEFPVQPFALFSASEGSCGKAVVGSVRAESGE